MRGLSRNKQPMWYSLLGEPETVYAKDKDGNIIYDTMPDGARVPRETGDKTDGYETPVKFYANIAASGGTAEAESYGVDLSAYDAILYAPKDTLPLSEMALIWLNEPKDKTTADYRVVRVPPCLDERVYLLEGVV